MPERKNIQQVAPVLCGMMHATIIKNDVETKRFNTLSSLIHQRECVQISLSDSDVPYKRRVNRLQKIVEGSILGYEDLTLRNEEKARRR